MCLFLSQSMLGSCKITVHSAEDEIEASWEIMMEPQTLALGVTRDQKVNKHMNKGSREDLGDQPQNPVTTEQEVDRQLSSVYRKWSVEPMLGILGCH